MPIAANKVATGPSWDRWNGEPLPSSGLFGLQSGQERKEWTVGDPIGPPYPNRVLTQQSGWYNQDGFWLGWGDLNLELDVRAIIHNLEPHELFIVTEQRGAPGRFDAGFVAQGALYVLARYQILQVEQFRTRHSDFDDHMVAVRRRQGRAGYAARWVTRPTVVALLNRSIELPPPPM